MNKLPGILLIILMSFNLSCAAALVGGLLYKSSKSKEAKKDFIANYNTTNIEREKAGLTPLDLCTEKYHFDIGWAKQDPVCRIRVEAYEAGDTTALGTTELKEPKPETSEPEKPSTNGSIYP